MGEYADVKRKRILQLLRWLATLDGFKIENGGKHHWIVRHRIWDRPFPIPFKYSTVSKVYVKELMKKVVAMGACTKEEFDVQL